MYIYILLYKITQPIDSILTTLLSDIWKITNHNEIWLYPKTIILLVPVFKFINFYFKIIITNLAEPLLENDAANL